MSKQSVLDMIQEKMQDLGIGGSPIILLAGLVFVVGLIFTGVRAYNLSLSNKKHEIEDYREALVYLEDRQAEYLKSKEAKEHMRQRLLEADTKIVSKLTSMASGLGFDVSVNPKDPLKTSDNSGAESQEISVTVRNVEFKKLLEYLVEINQLSTPIYLRKISFTRTSNNASSDTQMAAEITLVSYRLKEENAQ